MLQQRLMAPKFLENEADTAAIAARRYVIISDTVNPSSNQPLSSTRTALVSAQVLFYSPASSLKSINPVTHTERVLRKQLTLAMACKINLILTAVVATPEMTLRKKELGQVITGSWSPLCRCVPFEANKVMVFTKPKPLMLRLRGARAKTIISRTECILRIPDGVPSGSTASLSHSKISMEMVT